MEHRVLHTVCLSIAEQECMRVGKKEHQTSEKAPAAAIRAVYVNDLTVSVCWFHYGQAIMKRLKKIGLTEAYQKEETTQAVFRCPLALTTLLKVFTRLCDDV